MKTVYQTDANGIYLGKTTADESPLEPGTYLMPAGCVETPPPQVGPGLLARWTEGGWVVVSAPVEMPAEPTAEELASTARRRRDILLKRCDYTQLPDAPGDKAAWAAYRQALRDVTDQPGFPVAIDWPKEPA